MTVLDSGEGEKLEYDHYAVFLVKSNDPYTEGGSCNVSIED